MKSMLPKLERLLAGEIIALTIIISAGFSSIMMMAKLPRYADFLFSAPDSATTFLMLLLFIFPSILKFTVPVSLLLASAVTMMRMAADRELEAWMASGVSILRFSLMPTILGIFVMFVSLFSALIFEPYSNRQFDKFKWMQTRSAVEALLKNTIREQSFIYDFPNPNNIKLSLYFEKVTEENTKFSNVYLFLQKYPEKFSSVIISERGSLKKVSNMGYPDYVFSFYNGTFYSAKTSPFDLAKYIEENPKHYLLPRKNFNKQELAQFPAPMDWSVTAFSELNISLISAFKNKFKIDSNMEEGADQLYPPAYLAMLESEKEKNPTTWQTNKKIINKYLFFLKQISIPISTIFLPIIGICLGIRDPRSKQIGVYLGVGLVIFALYASLSVVQLFALKFLISPYAILFVTPVTLLFIIFLLLRWRLAHPPSTGFLDFVRNDLFKFMRKR